jgi:hypothetical protein
MVSTKASSPNHYPLVDPITIYSHLYTHIYNRIEIPMKNLQLFRFRKVPAVIDSSLR